jgi:hypothetical protein
MRHVPCAIDCVTMQSPAPVMEHSYSATFAKPNKLYLEGTPLGFVLTVQR